MVAKRPLALADIDYIRGDAFRRPCGTNLKRGADSRHWRVWQIPNVAARLALHRSRSGTLASAASVQRRSATVVSSLGGVWGGLLNPEFSPQDRPAWLVTRSESSHHSQRTTAAIRARSDWVSIRAGHGDNFQCLQGLCCCQFAGKWLVKIRAARVALRKLTT